MKTKFYSAFTLVAFLSVNLFSCKSVNKLYQKGDYDEAVLTAVKKLKKNKLKDETKELAADAYAKAINWHKQNLLSLMVNTDRVQWAPVLDDYDKMVELNNAIQRSPEALQYVTPVNTEKILGETYNQAMHTLIERTQSLQSGNDELKWEALENKYANMQYMAGQVARMENLKPYTETFNYETERADAADKAAAIRIDRGNRFMQYGDKQNARKAYAEFGVAARYRKGNSELEELKNRAFDAAATYVVVNSVGSRYYGYNSAANNIDRELLRALQWNSPSAFVKYFSPAQAAQLSRQPDEVIDVVLDDIRQGNAQTDRTQREVYKDNVLLREIRIRPDSVVKEYGRVTGRIITTRETINTIGIAYITVRDAQGRHILLDRRVEGNYCYTNEYSRFTGDERALSDNDRRLVNRRENDNRPSEWELMDHIGRELYEQVQRELRYYYCRY